jgi:hypothetical protein
VDRFELGVHKGRWQGTVRIGFVIAQQIDQRELYVTFTRDTAGADEHQRLIPRELLSSAPAPGITFATATMLPGEAPQRTGFSAMNSDSDGFRKEFPPSKVTC